MSNTEVTVNTKLVSLKEINKIIAKKLIVENHYSHAWSMCNVSLGIFYKKDNHRFFKGDVDKLIGCIVYGTPVGRQVISGISPLVKKGEVFELTRLWIEDGYGKNIESFVIAESFRWLKNHRPNIKMLISYADPNQGHLGRIYQATNWHYQFIKNTPDNDIIISLSGPPDYDWLHPRTLVSRIGARNKESIPKPYWKKFIRRKFRYLYFLCDRRQKRKIIENLIHPISPYPKNLEIKDEIIKVE